MEVLTACKYQLEGTKLVAAWNNFLVENDVPDTLRL